MEHNESFIKSLFNNLVRIGIVTIFIYFFRLSTYNIIRSLNKVVSLSWIGQYFYMSLLEIAVLLLIFKYAFNKKNKIIEADEKKIKINIFDILNFFFITWFLKTLLFEGLFYLENIVITGQNFENHVQRIITYRMNFTNLDMMYRIMSGIILGPVVEELFFRKGVFDYYASKKVSNRTIILISGVSFGLIHTSSLSILADSIIGGIILAVMFATTKNVIYPIIGHGINNLMQSITSTFNDYSDIVNVEAYIEANMIQIRGVIIISLILLVITSIISYIKRRTIISSDFKNCLIEVFTNNK